MIIVAAAVAVGAVAQCPTYANAGKGTVEAVPCGAAACAGKGLSARFPVAQEFTLCDPCLGYLYMYTLEVNDAYPYDGTSYDLHFTDTTIPTTTYYHAVECGKCWNNGIIYVELSCGITSPTGYPSPTNPPATPSQGLCPTYAGTKTVEAVPCGAAACAGKGLSARFPLRQQFELCDPCLGSIPQYTLVVQPAESPTSYFLQFTDTTIPTTTSYTVECGKCWNNGIIYVDVPCGQSTNPSPTNYPATPSQGLCPTYAGAVTVEAVPCGAAACAGVGLSARFPLDQEFGLCDPCFGPIPTVTLIASSKSSTTYSLQVKESGAARPQEEFACGSCYTTGLSSSPGGTIFLSIEVPCGQSTGAGGDSGVPVGAIVGGVVGGLILIGLIVGLVFFLRWRQGQMAKATGTGLGVPLSGAGQSTEMGSAPGAVHQGQDEMAKPCTIDMAS